MKLTYISFIKLTCLSMCFYFPESAFSFTFVRVERVAPHEINLNNVKNGSTYGMNLIEILDSSDIDMKDKDKRLLVYLDLSQLNLRPANILGGCTTAIPGLAVRFYSYDHELIANGDCRTPFYYYIDEITYTGSVFKSTWKSYFNFVVYDVNALPAAGEYNSGLNFGLNYRVFEGGDIKLLPLNLAVVGFPLSPNVIIRGSRPPTNRIIFPDYPSDMPSMPIRLNVSGYGHYGMTANGKAQLNMCLDDANGVNSSEYQLIFTDSSASPGSYQDFNLVNTQADGSVIDRIPYLVSIQNPKTLQQQAVNINSPIIWSNLTKNNSKTRSMMIDGKTVVCTDSPLTITIPRFNYSQKRGGHYLGKINILFTPTLNN